MVPHRWVDAPHPRSRSASQRSHLPTPVSPPAGRPALAHPAYELFAAALSLLAIVNVVLYLLIPDPALDTILAVMNGLFSVIFLLDFLYRARHASRSAPTSCAASGGQTCCRACRFLS